MNGSRPPASHAAFGCFRAAVMALTALVLALGASGCTILAGAAAGGAAGYVAGSAASDSNPPPEKPIK